MTQAKFPQDSYDAIERKYGSQIVSNFPNYGKFWELYIGRDTSTTQMKWYSMNFPIAMAATDRRRFQQWREELAIERYRVPRGQVEQS